MITTICDRPAYPFEVKIMSKYDGLAYSSQVGITFSLSVESKMSMDSRFFIVMWKIQFNVDDNDRVWTFVFWWRKCNFQGNLSSSQLHLLLCIYLQRRFLYIPFFYLSLWTIWGLYFMFLPTPSTALHICKVDLYTYWLHSYLDYSSFSSFIILTLFCVERRKQLPEVNQSESSSFFLAASGCSSSFSHLSCPHHSLFHFTLPVNAMDGVSFSEIIIIIIAFTVVLESKIQLDWIS